MRNLGIFLFLIVLVGCATRPAETPSLATSAKSASSEESALSQLASGCHAYRARFGRWPRTLEDVTQALASENLPSNHLHHIQSLKFSGEGASAVVDFVIMDHNSRFEGRLHLGAKDPN